MIRLCTERTFWPLEAYRAYRTSRLASVYTFDFFQEIQQQMENHDQEGHVMSLWLACWPQASTRIGLTYLLDID